MSPAGKDSGSGAYATGEAHIADRDRKGRRAKRIVVADDNPAIVHGVSDLLGRRFDVVATAANGLDLVEAVRRFSPDVVVTDLSMPVMNGIQAARRITNEHPGVKVVLLSIHHESNYVEAAFDAGASGYVLKFGASQELVPAIESVLAGASYRSARIHGSA